MRNTARHHNKVTPNTSKTPTHQIKYHKIFLLEHSAKLKMHDEKVKSASPKDKCSKQKLDFTAPASSDPDQQGDQPIRERVISESRIKSGQQKRLTQPAKRRGGRGKPYTYRY